jgi:hypothetical protein
METKRYIVKMIDVKNVIYKENKTEDDYYKLFNYLKNLSISQIWRFYEHIDNRRLYCETKENYEECAILRDLQIEIERMLGI